MYASSCKRGIKELELEQTNKVQTKTILFRTLMFIWPVCLPVDRSCGLHWLHGEDY